MYRILLTGNIPKELLELDKYKDIEFTVPEQRMSYDEVKAVAGEYDAVFGMGLRANAAFFENIGKMKALSNYGVGYDNIDVAAATEHGIAVINTPTQVTDATAEHTVALIMATVRNIARFDREVRAGIWKGMPIMQAMASVNGSTLGIVGFGRIGKSVCRKAQGVGMNVIYYDPFRASEEVEKEYDVTYCSFEELVKTADVITIHVPYTPENRHLFNAETFKMMKPDSFLVNCARGPIVDEEALVEALKNNVIRGAGIDVYENEPHPNEGLKTLDNVTLTPHIASATKKARVGMVYEALDGLIGVLKGTDPYNVVNKKELAARKG